MFRHPHVPHNVHLMCNDVCLCRTPCGCSYKHIGMHVPQPTQINRGECSSAKCPIASLIFLITSNWKKKSLQHAGNYNSNCQMRDNRQKSFGRDFGQNLFWRSNACQGQAQLQKSCGTFEYSFFLTNIPRFRIRIIDCAGGTNLLLWRTYTGATAMRHEAWPNASLCITWVATVGPWVSFGNKNSATRR